MSTWNTVATRFEVIFRGEAIPCVDLKEALRIAKHRTKDTTDGARIIAIGAGNEAMHIGTYYVGRLV